MTVQDQFTSWQTSPKKPDPKRCSPICGSWFNYLRIHWGGQHLGCYAARPVRGGTSLSSHGSGAAIDWRYENPGCGRQEMLNECMPFLINNSKELGIQAIHDYRGCRIWRPPGCSGRATTPSPECGWKQQKPSSGGMGQSWASWLHLEVHPSRWTDDRTVAQMLAPATPVKPKPPPPEDDDMTNEQAKQLDELWRYLVLPMPGNTDPNGTEMGVNWTTVYGYRLGQDIQRRLWAIEDKLGIPH